MRTNTIFGRSHIPLNKWLYAVYIVVTARKGMSSLQLSKEIGVTQKTVWFMLGRLREACGGDIGKLAGIVEIDETYIGGKCPNMSNAKRKELAGTGRGAVGKQAVMGMRERGGRSKAMPIEGTSRADLQYEYRQERQDRKHDLHRRARRVSRLGRLLIQAPHRQSRRRRVRWSERYPRQTAPNPCGRCSSAASTERGTRRRSSTCTVTSTKRRSGSTKAMSRFAPWIDWPHSLDSRSEGGSPTRN